MKDDARDRARSLILEYGWNTTSYQILNPGFTLWFSSDGNAVVGFVEHHGVRVVAGVPVCSDDSLNTVIDEFEHDAAARDCDVAYFAVEQRSVDVWQYRRNWSAVVIGAQPSWHPRELVSVMQGYPSLRAQLNRASNKGVRVVEWSCDRAEHSRELHGVLDEWLQRRGLPPLHFLVEPDTLPGLLDRHIFVAERDECPVGFLVAAPIRGRNGWLIEQNVRGDSAPNGTTEALLFGAAQWMAEHGSDLVTLGLAPLSRHAPASPVTPPRSLRALFAWIRVHGRRFYNFEGLDNYKSKFRPTHWEPIYLVVPRAHVWRSMLAIGAAFGGTSVVPFAARVLSHAFRHELLFARRRMKA